MAKSKETKALMGLLIKHLHDSIEHGQTTVIDGKEVQLPCAPAVLSVARQLLKDLGEDLADDAISIKGKLAGLALPFKAADGSDDEADALH